MKKDGFGCFHTKGVYKLWRKQMFLIICYEQQKKMRADKMNEFHLDLGEKNGEH